MKAVGQGTLSAVLLRDCREVLVDFIFLVSRILSGGGCFRRRLSSVERGRGGGCIMPKVVAKTCGICCQNWGRSRTLDGLGSLWEDK